MQILELTNYEKAKLKANLKTSVLSTTYLKSQKKVLIKFSSLVISEDEYCNIIVSDLNRLNR